MTQILQDGSNTYLYDNSRISQVVEMQPLQGASPIGYFLSDSLGSVRQVVDDEGALQLAKRFCPYGNVVSESGGNDLWL